MLGLYVPAAHGIHAALDELGLYVRAGQGVQEAAPAALENPAAHERHTSTDMLFVLGLYLPAAQLEHDAAPSELYVPSAQLEHDDTPPLLNMPGAQLVQDVTPAEL